MSGCVPNESEEQKMLFRWAAVMKRQMPELELMYHIPNEGKRSRVTGMKLKAEGLKSGVPDICLPVARKGYSALYIEMKRTVGGRVSDNQAYWIELLNKHGNAAMVARGWREAADFIEKYLK